MSKRKSDKSRSSLNTDNFRVELKPIQKTALNFLNDNQISIFSGSPGTGKDFIQLYRAVYGLISGEFSEIVFMKPIIEVGASIGFLPGLENEKLQPHQEAFLDNLQVMLQKTTFDRVKKKVRFEHIGFCRGKTFSHSAVILSESQNCTVKELITVSTRVAGNSKLFINGDKYQSDIRKSGFKDFVDIVKDIDGVGYMILGDEYQMRNKMIVDINKKYIEYISKNK